MNAKLSQFLRSRAEVRMRSPISLPPITQEFNSLHDELFSFYTYQLPRKPALQPRGGLSTPKKQLQLWREFQHSGADILPLTIDSNTRQNDYKSATSLYNKALTTGADTLNGYPILSIGLEKTKEIIHEISMPISLRHGTPDARLLVETAFSAGIYEIEGGGISYLFPYSKSYPLDICLANWRYVDRLCAFYNHNGAPVIRESFAPLTSTLVHPVISSLVQIIELVLAAKEGVMNFSVSISQTGNLAQDIATYNSLKGLVAWARSCFLEDDINIFYVYHQWMGAFPISRVKADALLAYANFTAMLMGCDKTILKTRDEALGIPSLTANAEACIAAKYTRDRFSLSSVSITSSFIEEESEFCFREVQKLLQIVLHSPNVNIYECISRAFRDGIIDIPFSPHISNLGMHSCKRALDGTIRVFTPGKIPFSDRFLKREKSLLETQVEPLNSSIDSIVSMILHFADPDDLQ